MTPPAAQSALEALVSSTIFDLTSDGFVVIAADTTVLRLNAAAERMFRYANDEIAGQPVERLFAVFTPEILQPLDPDRRGAEDRARRVQARRSDGSAFPIDLRIEQVPAGAESLTVLCARSPLWVRADPGETAANAARIGGFGYWSRDLATDIVSLSEEVRDLLRVHPDKASTDPVLLSDYLHPEDKDDFHRALDTALSSGERLDITHRIVTEDNLQRVVRSVGELRCDAAGRPVEILGVTFDVTERERVSEALRESENTLSAIVNSTTAMIYIKDVEGKYLLINRHFEDVFGVANETQRGNTDYSFLPKDVADAVRENDRDVREAGKPIEFEEVVPHQGEDHIYISIKFPLRRSSGEIYAVCGISTDITERKRAESELEATKRSLERIVDERTAKLRETNERLQEEIAERAETASRLQRIFDTAQEGIWIIDEAGLTTFANPRMGEMLGYEPDEMIGRPIFDFMSAERRTEASANLERRRQGISEDHDFEFAHKDGTPVWTLMATGPVNDQEGKMIGAVAMVTDITERKHAEEYQALLLQELDHRVKNTLATVVALSEITMTRAADIAEFAEAFNGRIQAMARTHEALAEAKWKALGFDELAALVLAPLRGDGPSRVHIRGDAVPIPPRAITPLALTLNELGTNALKHGALSCEGGSVELGWERFDDESLKLSWRESGGPPVSAGPTSGTGLQLIRGFVEYELGGKLNLDFRRSGLVCHLQIPARDGD